MITKLIAGYRDCMAQAILPPRHRESPLSKEEAQAAAGMRWETGDSAYDRELAAQQQAALAALRRASANAEQGITVRQAVAA